MSGTQDIKAAVKKRPTTFQVTPGESRPNRLTDHLTPQCTACGRRVAGNQSQAWHSPGFGRNTERGGRSANSTRNVWQANTYGILGPIRARQKSLRFGCTAKRNTMVPSTRTVLRSTEHGEKSPSEAVERKRAHGAA